MGDVAVSVENLGKQYRRGLPSGHDRMSEAMSNLGRALLEVPRRVWRRGRPPAPPADRPGDFWALRDVSFEVKRGEVVGIIGRNGAGKSTLLKILSRITEPTRGRFGLAGRVASLLEVGTGFHPELTGRENVYLNGSVLGMSRAEVRKKFDAIAGFAEIDDFLDTPVKRYSSGMQMRLGFAVAAHLEPEILVVDEVLAVGDAQFQKKCLGKMGEIAVDGRTVLFVSHSSGTVRKLCTRAIALDKGAVAFDGPADQVLLSYQSLCSSATRARPLEARHDRTGDGRIRLVHVAWENNSGDLLQNLRSGEDCRLILHYRCAATETLRSPVVVSFALLDVNGQVVMNHRNDFTAQVFESLPNTGRFVCEISKLPLAEGSYSLNLFVGTDNSPFDSLADVGVVTVERGDFFGTGHCGDPMFCKVFVDASWSHGSLPNNCL
ncbi:MAG: transporter, ATP-binding protein [Gemmataceae bacterium]|nr:transporter, ATP-binding protein [Gemmataceae bacterium]